MPRKKTNVPLPDAEELEEPGQLPVTYEAQRADAHIRDVSKYKLPPDLEARIAYYSDTDPVFCDHIRRAHKYLNALPEGRGQEPWKIEVKLFDYDEGEFNKFGPSHRENVPTPEELRAENAYGKLRFVIFYWSPYKTVKGNVIRPGLMTIKSKVFEIAAPVSVMGPMQGTQPPQTKYMQQNAPAMSLPPASFVDAFQTMFAQTQNLMMQAANAQMEILANRQKIVDEGVEKGRLLQQVEIQNLQIAELMKTIKGFQSVRDDDDDHDYSTPPASVTSPQAGGMSPMLGVLIEKLAPVVLDKLGLNGTAAGVVTEAVKGAAGSAPNAEKSGEGQQN